MSVKDAPPSPRLIEPGRAALVLAPMEGVTDAPMRALMTERGGFTFCVSEFLRISDSVPPARSFHDHMPELLQNGGRTPSGTPIQLQLLGGNEDRLAQAATRACELGSPGVDLNFGCPAPTVNRHDGGATLLKHPDRIESIVRAVRRAVPPHLPVSAKLRLGWDDIRQVHLNSEKAASGGASWITIHARTRLQGYEPPVHWRPIGEVRRSLGIPVVANGDIWSLDDLRRCQEQTGCEHFMLGRSALADPALPLRAARHLGLFGPAPEEASAPEWGLLLARFAELSRRYSEQDGYAIRRIKQWVRIRHGREPLHWFDAFKRTQTLAELFECLERARP